MTNEKSIMDWLQKMAYSKDGWIAAVAIEDFYTDWVDSDRWNKIIEQLGLLDPIARDRVCRLLEYAQKENHLKANISGKSITDKEKAFLNNPPIPASGWV